MRLAKYILILLLLAAPAWATDYYIGTNGDYASYSALTSAITLVDGDDIYFECGDEWDVDSNSDQIDVNIEGVSPSNHTVIGAWYDDGGRVNSQDSGFSLATCGSKPKFDGKAWIFREVADGVKTVFTFTGKVYDEDLLTWVYRSGNDYCMKNPEVFTCATYGICGTFSVNADQEASPGGTLTVTFGGSPPSAGTDIRISHQGYPANYYYGIIDVTGSQADPSAYVTTEYLDIRNSGGMGIWYKWAPYGVIQYNDVDTTAASGAIMSSHCYEGIIQYNTFEKTCFSYTHSSSTAPDGNLVVNWGFATGVIDFGTDALIQYNVVNSSWGEGIGIYYASRGAIAQYNVVRQTQSTGIYISDCGDNIIRYNQYYGTTDDYYFMRCQNRPGEGLGATHECTRTSNFNSYYSQDGNKIYGNIVSGAMIGIDVAGGGTAPCAPYSYAPNTIVSHNLMIGNDTGLRFDGNQFTDSYAYNNIIIANKPNTVMIDGASDGDVDFENNAWYKWDGSTTPELALAIDNGDVSAANVITNGDRFYDVSLPDAPTLFDAVPAGNSAVVDAANTTGLGGVYNYRLAQGSTLPDNPAVMTALVSPDIGPIEYTGFPQNQTPTCTIDSPVGNQSIAVDASLSFSSTCTDPDGSIDIYIWDFDNSGIAQSTDEDPGSKTFAVEGTFNVCVTASDNLGAVSSPACVQISVGTPSGSTSYVDWQLENDLTDNNANQALTDGDSISYAGSEPDPPGYGSNGAVFNGTSDYLYVTNTNIGNHLCSGTSTKCTMIIGFTANTTDTGYLWAYYDPDDMGLAVQYNGTPRLITGYNSGNSYQFLSIPHTYGAASVVLGLSIDMTTKEYVYSSKEMGAATFYDIDHNSNPLTGTLHDPNTDLTIGARNDGASKASFFNGTIWWMQGYDSALSLSELHDAMENASQSAGANVTVDTGTTIPYITIETGTNDLNLEYVSGTGTPILLFQGTVLAASNHTSAVAVDYASGYGSIQDPSNKISGNVIPARVWCPDSGKTFGDTEVISVYVEFASNGSEVLTLPTAGASGSLSYESPIYIDTTEDTIVSTCAVAHGDDTWTCVSEDHIFIRGQRPRMKVTFSGTSYFNDGPNSNIQITYTPTTGNDLVFVPSGYGVGANSWGFIAQPVESGMQELVNLDADSVNDLVHGATTIEDAAGNELSSYALPSVNIDQSYQILVDGSSKIWLGGSGATVHGQEITNFLEWKDTSAPLSFKDSQTSTTIFEDTMP